MKDLRIPFHAVGEVYEVDLHVEEAQPGDAVGDGQQRDGERELSYVDVVRAGGAGMDFLGAGNSRVRMM